MNEMIFGPNYAQSHTLTHTDTRTHMKYKSIIYKRSSPTRMRQATEIESVTMLNYLSSIS